MNDCLTNDRYCLAGFELCEPCADRLHQRAVDDGIVCQCGHRKYRHGLEGCWEDHRCACKEFAVYYGDEIEGVPA